MSCIVGIDPGVTGALACFAEGELVDVMDMPVNDSRADGNFLAKTLGPETWDADTVYLEWTHPMPKNGSIASYSLGLNSGIVIGVVQALGIPLERVRPAEWKLKMGLRGKPKSASRGMATELFPHQAHLFRLVKHDGRAEAALIARYGAYRNIRSQVEELPEREEAGTVSDLRGARDRHPARTIS